MVNKDFYCSYTMATTCQERNLNTKTATQILHLQKKILNKVVHKMLSHPFPIFYYHYCQTFGPTTSQHYINHILIQCSITHCHHSLQHLKNFSYTSSFIQEINFCSRVSIFIILVTYLIMRVSAVYNFNTAQKKSMGNDENTLSNLMKHLDIVLTYKPSSS